MKSTLFTVGAAILLLQTAQAQVSLPFYDGFSYSAGADLAGNGSWFAASGSGTVKVNAASLTYPNLQSSAGNDVTVTPTGTSARTCVHFTPKTSGAVYFSFLLKIKTIPSAQRLFAYAYSGTGSTSTPYLGYFVNSNAQLAVGIHTSSPQFTSSSLSVGATYLVVVGYTFGPSNDSAEVWINPGSLGGNAPMNNGAFTASHNSSLAYFHWNTPSASSGGGSYEVDELRIGSTYAEVTSAAFVAPLPEGLRVTEFSLAGANATLIGKGGPSNGLFEVLATTDLALPFAVWNVAGANSFDASGNFSSTVPVSDPADAEFFLVGVATPPSITAQPMSQPAATGQNITLNVVASGGLHLNYQWFKDGQPITNATNPTFTLTNAQFGDSGSYTVSVSNSFGSITSAAAIVSVNNPQTDGNFYVSPAGSDSNPGTLNAPFYSLAAAVAVAAPGDLIYMRGGTYNYTATVFVTKFGSESSQFKIFAYPGEKPVLSWAGWAPPNSTARGAARGVKVTGSYWHLKGLEISYAPDNGVKCEGHHITFEQCIFHHNGDTGIQIGLNKEDYSANPDPDHLAAYNYVFNCDSYRNADPATSYENADGFACKLYAGRGNHFYGCRAWENCDDGWDCYQTDFEIVIDHCWSWHNGDPTIWGFISFNGDGNGFKLGGADTFCPITVKNCVTLNCQWGALGGYAYNNNTAPLTLYNCTALNCGRSYNMQQPNNIIKNCVDYNATRPAPRDISSSSIQQNDTWTLGITSKATDFVSISEADAAAPRQADGNLPNNGFARLTAGSTLIDKGVDVGIPFNGTAPDLGAFEFGP